MTALREIVRNTRAPHPSYEGNWFAVVATNADDITDEVEVIIPAFDPVLRWGPCRWTPRGDQVTFPQRGDECLIVFDNRNIPWITCWWPF